ncbi:MAG: phosphate signaling complex protein PhoU [Halobacteria archaeon]
MARTGYVQQLEALKSGVAEMGGMAREAVEKAMDAFVRLNLSRVEEVRSLDKSLYQKRLELEALCFDLLALQTPVAADLRMVGTCLDIVKHLDRHGRYAMDIAESAERLAQGRLKHYTKLTTIPEMHRLAHRMIEQAIGAFVHMDANMLPPIYEAEEKVDELYEELFRKVAATMMENPDRVLVGLRYIFVARYLERIADHAKDIADGVSYVATGQRVVH